MTLNNIRLSKVVTVFVILIFVMTFSWASLTVLNVNPTTGPAPLTITMTGECGDDAEECILTIYDSTHDESSEGDEGAIFKADGGHDNHVSATYTLTNPGTYTVALEGLIRVEYFEEEQYYYYYESDEKEVTVIVSEPTNMPPVATLSGPATGEAPLAASFSGGCSDSDGNLASCTVSFGEGPTISTTTGTFSPGLSHTYTTPGTYTVTITARDSDGLTNTKTITITVTGTPPNVDLVASPTIGDLPLKVVFTGGCSSTVTAISSCKISFGEDATVSFSSGITHTYTKPGQYIATLTAVDSKGLTASKSVTININNYPPTAELAVNPSTLEVFVKTAFSGKCEDPDGNLDSCVIEFGDDLNAIFASGITHAYKSPGEYIATLTATDKDGLKATATVSVTVINLIINSPLTWCINNLMSVSSPSGAIVSVYDIEQETTINGVGTIVSSLGTMGYIPTHEGWYEISARKGALTTTETRLARTCSVGIGEGSLTIFSVDEWCVGQSVEIVTEGGSTISVSDPSSGFKEQSFALGIQAVLNYVPKSAGTYTIYATKDDRTDTIERTATSCIIEPIISITTTETWCVGESVDVTSDSGAYIRIRNPSGSLVAEGSTTLEYVPNVEGTYSIKSGIDSYESSIDKTASICNEIIFTCKPLGPQNCVEDSECCSGTCSTNPFTGIGECVQCNGAEDCNENYVCNDLVAGGTCELECSESNPCETGEICGDDKICYPDPGCPTIACPNGFACNSDGECTNKCPDVACPNGFACTPSGTCTNQCPAVACPEGLACDDNGVCTSQCPVITCMTGTQCSLDGSCVAIPECVVDQDCASTPSITFACVAGICIETNIELGCTSNSDCQTGNVCLPDGTCVLSTTTCPTIPCADGLACTTDGTCTNKCPDVACADGLACTTDGTCTNKCPDVPCQQGSVCSTEGACIITQTCPEIPCSDGFLCSPDGLCIETAPVCPDTPCSEGFVCSIDGACIAPTTCPEVSCNVGFICSDSVCKQTSTCQDVPCADGFTCQLDGSCKLDATACPPVPGFHYQLQTATSTELSLLNVNYLVVDMDDLDSLTGLKQGNTKVLSYLSVGEAENYRDYWQSDWTVGSPSFVDAENPQWAGNYKVKYWDPAWQEIILNQVELIAAAGYDGVYLDIIDAYDYYEEQGRETAAEEMIDFVKLIHDRGKSININFLIIPQNSPELYEFAEYKNNIDGFGKEDTWYDDNSPQGTEETDYVLPFLRNAINDGKFVLAIDYPTETSEICDFYNKCSEEGFHCTVSNRDLDRSEALTCPSDQLVTPAACGVISVTCPDTPCSEGQICSDGTCVSEPIIVRETCPFIPCAEGSVCTIDRVCVETPKCPEVACVEGSVCSEEGVCVESLECTSSSECSSGEQCSSGSCIKPARTISPVSFVSISSATSSARSSASSSSVTTSAFIPPVKIVRDIVREVATPLIYSIFNVSRIKTTTAQECVRGASCTTSEDCCGTTCYAGSCACSTTACVTSADCCTGYCDNSGKCSTPQDTSLFVGKNLGTLDLNVGCVGLIEECDPSESNCISICNGLTFLLALVAGGSGAFAWSRYKHPVPGVTAAIVPLLVGLSTYPFVGIIIGLMLFGILLAKD